MYKKILVPLDGSPLGGQALPYVRLLGTALKVPVELLRVYEPEPVYYFPSLSQFQERVQAAAQHREEALHSLDSIGDSLKSQRINVTTTVYEPHGAPQAAHNPHDPGLAPAHHIIEVAEREADTLIVMCTHGRSGIGRWVMGSVTDKVLHATTNPLFIVRGQPEESAQADAKLESIIVPLDGSAIAEQILPHAVALSQALRAKLRPLSIIPSDQSHAREEDHLSRLGERLVKQGAHSFEVRVLHGEPAHAIVDMTHEFPGALVAMTTHGHSGIGRWVLGSVTDKVVRHSAGPVLVTRAT